PYTPLLARIELDYRAAARIRLGEVPASVATKRGEMAVHVAPFGISRIHPDPEQPEPGVLPRRAVDGALYLGLERLRPGQPVSLLFHMAERPHHRRGGIPPSLEWSCLTERGWVELDAAAILADTTSGLLRSGVLTIQVPDEATTAGEGMPEGIIWLRAGADTAVVDFPRLAALVVNGVTASRSDTAGTTSPHTLATWRLRTPIAGLETVRQIGLASTGVPAESTAQYRARVSERLRHRNRALTPWDYERLVLDRFPDVWKVKCLPATADDVPGAPVPGRVLVVVVPHATTAGPEQRFEPRMFDVLTLDRIHQALARLAPPTAAIEVRNPTYDLIQLRCHVRFVDAADQAMLVRRLTDDVTAYLSPWAATTTGPELGFGWQLNAEDAEGFVAERPYVANVFEFAMLMLSADDRGRYRLADTARPARHQVEPSGGLAILRHSVPWSLPLPLRRQALLPTRRPGRLEAAAAGVGELEIGGTLVVGDGLP
ncbi:MAG: hypothetical protein EA356_13205, partial [Geminicoccaceae bacterium]